MATMAENVLAAAQEVGVILKEEQQDFMADGLEEFNSDCEDLQLNTTSIFKADHVDAFDSNCDEAPTASAIFMARLSFSTEYSEHLVSNINSYDELMSDSNVISYANYMTTIENDVSQSVPPPKQDNAMILSNGTGVNTKFVKPLTSGNKLYFVTSFPKTQFIPKVVEKFDLTKTVTSQLHTNKVIKKCTKVLAPGLLRIESEPINAYFKNNWAVHQDYLKVTKEHIQRLHELLEQARSLKPLDENLDYACKFAQRIQELLVYICASCPYVQRGNDKWSPTTSTRKNKKPYVDTFKTNKTVVNNTQKHAAKQNTQKTDNTLFPSTRRESYTYASGSQPRSNTRNDMIQKNIK
ncbi:hypothetical protein Tco_0556650 [Tanacetum coccineum]